LYELSATTILALAKAINDKAKIDRKLPLQILNLVADALTNGQIDRTRIKWKSQEDFEKLDKVLADSA
jgi:hypothetical protein